MIPALVSFFVVAVLSMSGLVSSADAAGPGDFLYGLDTAIENVRLTFTRDDEKKAELRLEFATERLEELKIEIEGEGDRQLIEQAITEFEAALASIEGLLDELSLEQRAAFEEALAQLLASERDLIEFEFELEIEDGQGELKLELELQEDGDDLEDHDLDDDEMDDDLEDHDQDDDDLDDDEVCDDDGSSDQTSSEGEDDSADQASSHVDGDDCADDDADDDDIDHDDDDDDDDNDSDDDDDDGDDVDDGDKDDDDDDDDEEDDD